MNGDTKHLISALAADLTPVKRLAGPGLRLLRWIAVGLPFSLLLGALLESQNPGLAWQRIQDPRLVAEIFAILATAVAAGYAALSSVYPGRSPLAWGLPVVPFLAWLSFVGESCWQLWTTTGGQVSFAPHWSCYPSVVATGLVPAVAIVVMLRKGKMLHLPVTVALATLAASALGAVGLRLYHIPDAAVLLFLWQFIATVTFFVVAGVAGKMIQTRRYA